MTDHPIIFSAPMIKALLAGRKTQTRRLAWREYRADPDDAPKAVPARLVVNADGKCALPSPWQKVKHGDRLWVRESVMGDELAHSGTDGVRFIADNAFIPIENTFEAADRWVDLHNYRRKRAAIVPPIHMPRWASRLTLELVGMPKIESLMLISEDDARAEGVELIGLEPNYYIGFRRLWRELHGAESWDASPEVCVLYFRVHQVNIDRMKEAA